MKLKTTGLLFTAAAIGFAANANAGLIITPYVGAVAGVGRQTIYANGENESTNVKSYGAVLGMDIPLLRVEGEYSYLDTKDLDANVAMFNAYFKIPSVIVKPYIGGGIGSVFGGNYDLKSTTAYQGIVGATLDIFALPIKPDLEARVLYAPNIVDNIYAQPDLLDYQVRLKLRYNF